MRHHSLKRKAGNVSLTNGYAASLRTSSMSTNSRGMRSMALCPVASSRTAHPAARACSAKGVKRLVVGPAVGSVPITRHGENGLPLSTKGADQPSCGCITHPVWLNNSPESRRVAIVIAQEPPEALATPDLTAVAPKIRLGGDELVGEALMIALGTRVGQI